MTEARHLPETVVVGRVGKPHGVRGEVTVEALTDVPDRFAVGQSLLLNLRDRIGRSVEVVASRPHGAAWVVKLQGCEDRDQAADLRGALLEVALDDVPPPPEGSWYHYQLIGCRCVDREAGNLGRVVEVVEDGGGWILEIEDNGRRLLLPLVEAYLLRVDVANGLIETDVPRELIETCASTS
jgi:16S rRNA processing protein RimM